MACIQSTIPDVHLMTGVAQVLITLIAFSPLNLDFEIFFSLNDVFTSDLLGFSMLDTISLKDAQVQVSLRSTITIGILVVEQSSY